jgi:hypothetical protein
MPSLLLRRSTFNSCLGSWTFSFYFLTTLSALIHSANLSHLPLFADSIGIECTKALNHCFPQNNCECRSVLESPNKGELLASMRLLLHYKQTGMLLTEEPLCASDNNLDLVVSEPLSVELLVPHNEASALQLFQQIITMFPTTPLRFWSGRAA